MQLAINYAGIVVISSVVGTKDIKADEEDKGQVAAGGFNKRNCCVWREIWAFTILKKYM